MTESEILSVRLKIRSFYIEVDSANCVLILFLELTILTQNATSDKI